MTTLTSDSSSEMDRAAEASPALEPSFFGLRAESWLRIGVISALFASLFWPNLRRLWDKTNPFTGEPNWGHAVAVPLIGLYYLYINRDQLRAIRARPAWSGLVIAVFGMLFSGYGIYPGQNDLFKDVGMVIALFGIVTLLCGWQVMKIAWFPIVFLFCALPWPGILYSKLAGPLQELAANVAVKVLHVANVEAGQYGTKIFIAGKNSVVRTLNVAEACAGLRSLMTFISVAAAIAFLSNRAMWQRIILVASAVPIAIFCNVMRVSGQGLLDHYVSPQLSESFAHQFVGLVMMIPAFFLILLVSWILQHIFIEEIDDKTKLKAAGQGRAAFAAASGGTVIRRTAPVTIAAPTAAKPQAGASTQTQSTQAATGQPAAPRPAAAPRPLTAPAPRPGVIPPRPAGMAGAKLPPRPGQQSPPRPAPDRSTDQHNKENP